MRVAGLKNTYDVSLLQREIIIVATGVQAGGARGAASTYSSASGSVNRACKQLRF